MAYSHTAHYTDTIWKLWVWSMPPTRLIPVWTFVHTILELIDPSCSVNIPFTCRGIYTCTFGLINIVTICMNYRAFVVWFFSRNQLSTIPPFICQLQSLEVLLASNNKLVSLPEEIGHLEKLMELVSIVNKQTNFSFKTSGLPLITLLFEFNFPASVDVAIIVNKRSF